MSDSQAAMTMQSSVQISARGWAEPLVGLFAGAIGGALYAILLAPPFSRGVLYGALFGLFFAMFFAKRATSAGAGLIWGLAFALLTWLVFPAGILPLLSRSSASQSMLVDARDRFPQLVAFLICFGMPVGVSLGIWCALHPKTAQPKFNWGRAIVAGGLAGT